MRRRVPLAGEAIFAVIELVDVSWIVGRRGGESCEVVVAHVGVTGLGVSHGIRRSRVIARDTAHSGRSIGDASYSKPASARQRGLDF